VPTIVSNLLTDREVKKLFNAIMRGGGVCSNDDATAVMEWASKIRVEAGLLMLVLKGRLDICVLDGKVQLTQGAEADISQQHATKKGA
jgi:hypothetical protein